MNREIRKICSLVTLGLAAAFTAFPLTPAARADAPRWPGWLGPERNGQAKQFKPPSSWPEKLDRIWTVEVGSGYGTPLVAGNSVYQHARQGDQEVVWRLDLKTGQKKWRKAYDIAFTMGQGGTKHGKGPKSSPVLADGRLFTLSITGVLSAWNADSGELLWRENFREHFSKNQPYWGVATSPLVEAGKVIVHMGDEKTGALFALDVKTGKPVWIQDKYGATYSSPLVVEVEGVRQIVEWNPKVLMGIAIETGEPLWEFSFPERRFDQNTPTPIFHDGCFFLGGENRGMRSVRPQLKDGTWTALEQWFQPRAALDMSTPVIGGEFLFGMTHYKSGQLFCLDPKTGEFLWEGPARTGENVAFVSIPGSVLALINDGELRIIAATDEEYRITKSYRVSERETWAPPVLLEDRMLIKDETHLTLWSL